MEATETSFKVIKDNPERTIAGLWKVKIDVTFIDIELSKDEVIQNLEYYMTGIYYWHACISALRAVCAGKAREQISVVGNIIPAKIELRSVEFVSRVDDLLDPQRNP